MHVHSFRTQHQAGDVRERGCGFLKYCDSVCKKLRKFDDAELEQQFVQHHYRPPMYFCVITALAVCYGLGGMLPIILTFQYMDAANVRAGAAFLIAGVAFLLSGIGLIVAARIRHIRESHWEKVALAIAALTFAGVIIFVIGSAGYTEVAPRIDNSTVVVCTHLFNPSAEPAPTDSIEAAVCTDYQYGIVLINFLLVWLCPLCLTWFGLDFRRYAPLLFTEVIVSYAILGGISLRFYHLYPRAPVHMWQPALFTLIFSLTVLVSLLWSSLSSESAARGAWIRQQNW